MIYTRKCLFVQSTLLVLSIIWGISAKSITNSDSPQPQTQFQPYIAKPVETVPVPAPGLEPAVVSIHDQSQPQQHNGEVNYPQYGEDENLGSYDYHSASSEEMMPVKNSEYVPVESPEDYNGNGTNGFPPQRQVSLQTFWHQYHNSMGVPPNSGNKEVEDEGSFEVVTDNYPNMIPLQYQPQQQPPHHHPHPVEQEDQQSYYQMPHYIEELLPIATPASSVLPPTPPPTPKISKVAKLIVEAGRNANGKIAVVRDKLKASRHRRSMMTLSREDENDSEYDDVSSSEKVTSSSTNNSTVKATTKKS